MDSGENTSVYFETATADLLLRPKFQMPLSSFGMQGGSTYDSVQYPLNTKDIIV